MTAQASNPDQLTENNHILSDLYSWLGKYQNLSGIRFVVEIFMNLMFPRY